MTEALSCGAGGDSLQQNHLSASSVAAGAQAVEVEPGSERVTLAVPRVPDGCVEARRLMAIYQSPDQSASDIIDVERDLGVCIQNEKKSHPE